MLIKRAADIRSSEITNEQVYLDRRRFVRAAGIAAAASVVAIGCGTPQQEAPPPAAAPPPPAVPPPATAAPPDEVPPPEPAPSADAAATEGPFESRLAHAKKSPLSTNETKNTFDQITSYNNYYEFG